jgi:2-amino-4-hydroxy-6-hydroxymethyldihydropteridine diphosphokinase
VRLLSSSKNSVPFRGIISEIKYKDLAREKDMGQCQIYLSLGTNCGDRINYIERMELMLGQILEPPVKKSRIMETEPVDVAENQTWYLNRIIGAQYSKTPSCLLQETQEIENVLGRTEKGTMKSRTADIDILLFGNSICNSDILTIPHRGILKRRFCLEGLNDIDSSIVIPGLQKSVHAILDSKVDELQLQGIRYI